MNQNNNPAFNQKKKTKKRQHHSNFVEALKSIGSSTAKSFKDDLVKGSAQDAINSMVSPGAAPPQNNESAYSPDMYQPDRMQQREQELIQEQRHREQHKEMTLTPVFDRRQEQVKGEIKALREELSALAQELGKMGQSVQKAIDEEIENPGTYHVNYFEKLRRFITNLRKQVGDSSNWLELSSQRKAAKNHYWGNVKKSGTKYMLSHDRSVVTQTG